MQDLVNELSQAAARKARAGIQRERLQRYRESLPKECGMYKVALHRISTGESLIVDEANTLEVARYMRACWDALIQNGCAFGFAVYILPVDANA
jgi:hypothetical protein